ncbi:acetolactate decarboxylase [Cloacibacillus evryensis]
MRIFGDITREREGLAAAARGARTRGLTMRRAGAALAALALLLCVMNAPVASAAAAKDNDTLYQVSTLNALMLGDYDGSVTLGDLKKQGSIGLGTFDKLDGEMTVLDGHVYQTKGDGRVAEPDDSVTAPFACVTRFEADKTFEVKNVADIKALTALLDGEIRENRNIFYAVKLTGTFGALTVRTENAQEKPYKDLSTVLKDQAVFNYKDIRGTVVAIYCPNYVTGLNAPGWHLHFVSADRTKGGHVLAVAVRSAKAELDTTTQWTIDLPDKSAAFAGLKLETDLAKETKEVETKH